MQWRFPFPFGLKEKRLAVFSALVLFFIVAAFIILKSARDALFLSRYSSQSLPYFMAFNTGVSALAATIYLRFYRLYSFNRLIRLSFVFFALGTLLFWSAIDERDRLVVGFLYLWVGIFGTIAPVQGWALVSQQFSARQAQRSLGVIGAGAVLGAIAGGLFARHLTNMYGIRSLIPFAGVFILLALAASFVLAPPQRDEPKSVSMADKPAPIRRRFVVLMLLIVSTSTIVSAFIDFQFKTVAQRQFVTAENLATFFGGFYAYLGAATLLFQLFGTPLLMRRFGVAATLSMLPLSLFISNSLVFVTGLFGSTLLLRGSEELLRHSVDRSSLEVLYVSLPEHQKTRIKAIIDTIGVRVPEGLAALALIGLFSVADLPHSPVLMIINGVMLSIWIAGSYLLGRREYPNALREEIERKEVDFEALKESLFTRDFYRVLPELFRNAEKDTVLSLLDLLETSGKRWLGRYISIALMNEHPEIQLKALRILFFQDADLSNQVSRLIRSPEASVRVEAIHYLSYRGKLGRDLEAELRKEEDPAIKVALTAGDLKSKAMQDSVYAKLEQLRADSVEQDRPDVRAEIAHVLEYIRTRRPPVDLFTRLLEDKNQGVVRSAVCSIERTKPPGVIPSLFQMSRSVPFRSEVRSALVAYGPTLLPYLIRVLHDSALPPPDKKLALRIASIIGGARVIRLLFEMASADDLTLRFAAIKALNRMKKNWTLPPSPAAVIPLIENELQNLEQEFKKVSGSWQFSKTITAVLLRQRILWSFERLFRLFGLMYEPDAIYYAYLGWISNDQRRSDAAIELLHHTLEPELRIRIFPLLESYNLDPEESETADAPDFKAYLSEEDPLLLAAAIHDLSDTEFVENRSRIESTAKRINNPIVAEVVEQRRKTMADEGAEQTFTTIQKLESLGKIDIFSRLGPQDLLLLAGQSTLIEFAAGAIIFAEGEVARQLYSLIEGTVELQQSNEHMGVVRPGESFGSLEILADQPRVFTACAKEPCRCLKIDRNVFWEIVEDYPSVCRGILGGLVQQVQSLTDRLAAATRVNIDVLRQ